MAAFFGSWAAIDVPADGQIDVAVAAAKYGELFDKMVLLGLVSAVICLLMVPLIKRRLTGQIAGMAGAYGNVGGVVFLTALSFVDPHAFFLILAATAAVTLALVFLMDEPQGHTAEVLPDGTVQMINVS